MTRPDDAVDGAELLNSVLSEKDFQAQIVELAEKIGWRKYHTYDSRRSDPGFPDLVLALVPRLIFVECKLDKASSKLTQNQRDWLEILKLCGQEVYVWRPSDWDTIVKVLE